MDEPIDVQFTNFHCCAERHLARLSPVCALIYPFALRISKTSGKFTCSAASAAEFLGFSLRTIQRGYQQLRHLGFFELTESGKFSFESSIYRVMRHDEWAERNPGKCTEKLAYAWTKEGDSLGQKLWVESGCRVKFLAFRVNALRSTGIPEAEIVSAFREWYPIFKAAQKGRKWRRSVSYHFVMYVRKLFS